MTKESIMTGLGGVLIGILIAVVLLPGQNTGNKMMGRQMMGEIDAHFIEQMIPHHEDAIAMAKLALTKSEHQQIKSLAQDIVKSQTKEIEDMTSWYKTWYGKEVPDANVMMGHRSGMMHGGMMGDTTDLQSLENAKPFDKDFIEQMIPHHQMAVMMAQMLKISTERSEMKKLADDIISAQTKEINEMRSWYSSWY